MEPGELINPEEKIRSGGGYLAHWYKSHLRESGLNKEKNSYAEKVI